LETGIGLICLVIAIYLNQFRRQKAATRTLPESPDMATGESVADAGATN
jgi:hypothetical protein